MQKDENILWNVFHSLIFIVLYVCFWMDILTEFRFYEIFLCESLLLSLTLIKDLYSIYERVSWVLVYIGIYTNSKLFHVAKKKKVSKYKMNRKLSWIIPIYRVYFCSLNNYVGIWTRTKTIFSMIKEKDMMIVIIRRMYIVYV